MAYELPSLDYAYNALEPHIDARTMEIHHSKHHQRTCLEILNAARGAGIFDIRLESIVGKAALNMSDKALGERILASAGRAAEDRSKSSTPISFNASDLQVAWFYSFVSLDSTKALAWANRAYSDDPNSADAKAILSYAMAVGSVSKEEGKLRLETARGLLTDGQEPLCQVNQIAAVAMALVELRAANSKAADKFLHQAVEMDANSFAAERANPSWPFFPLDLPSPLGPGPVFWRLPLVSLRAGIAVRRMPLPLP